MKALFLVEHKHQVTDILKQTVGHKGQWIALGPSAMWALDRSGRSYYIPEDFYDDSELNLLCRQTHRNAVELCEYLDHKLHEQFPRLPSWFLCIRV